MPTVAESIAKIESLFFDEDIVGGIVEERKQLREGLQAFADAIVFLAFENCTLRVKEMVHNSALK